MKNSELVWKTKDDREIDMMTMEPDHLQRALIVCQRKEYETFVKYLDLMDEHILFKELADKLKAAAIARIESGEKTLCLQDIDQVKNLGNVSMSEYFNNKRISLLKSQRVTNEQLNATA